MLSNQRKTLRPKNEMGYHLALAIGRRAIVGSPTHRHGLGRDL